MRKIKPFVNKYKWEGINFPSEKDNSKKFEKNNVTITLLNVKEEKMSPIRRFQKINQIMKSKLLF